MASITAKYRSQCHVCGDTITPGQRIEYAKGQPTRHATCHPVALPADAIHLSRGQGYGSPHFQGWTPGEVIQNPQAYETRATCQSCGYVYSYTAPRRCTRDGCDRGEVLRHQTRVADQPAFLWVLTASRRYYREDGLSFGVGQDSGYVYSAACRPATDEEAAPLRVQLAAAEQRRQAAAALKSLERRFIDEGEYVEGDHVLAGERVDVGQGQTIHGGGSWFVIETEHIWHVLNNGADGDNWSQNNVVTGGAGGIGRRLPYSAELAETLKRLSQEAWLKEGKANG